MLGWGAVGYDGNRRYRTGGSGALREGCSPKSETGGRGAGGLPDMLTPH